MITRGNQEGVRDGLADRLSIAALATVFPGELVDEVIDKTGCREQRSRSLPAWLMVYYVLALAVYPDRGYQEVMRLLTEGLSWLSEQSGRAELPSVAAITRARSRLGEAPLRLLFNQVAGPLAAEEDELAWRGLRVASLDALTLQAPDTEANVDFFRWRPDDDGGASLPPVARVSTLAECSTGSLLDASLGPEPRPGRRPERGMTAGLDETTLLLADRKFSYRTLWAAIATTGTHLLWETALPARPMRGRLPDGSYLCPIPPVPGKAEDRMVRAIDGQITRPGAHPRSSSLTLLTTLLDPAEAPAPELATIYANRWRASKILRSLNIVPKPHAAVLRSRNPSTVRQEIWAMLCVYQALRIFLWQAARGPDGLTTFTRRPFPDPLLRRPGTPST